MYCDCISTLRPRFRNKVCSMFYSTEVLEKLILTITGRWADFFCFFELRPSQPIRVMLSAVSLSHHTFSWAGLVL